MRTEITKLHHRLATTFIYVTHDQVEAMTMGTRIVVMKDGYIQQVDAPQKLYDYPANMFVAGFIGSPQMNFFNAVLTGDKDKVYVEFENNKLPDYVVAAVGGGSNAIGIFTDFVKEEGVKLIGVEPAGFGIETGKHGAPLGHGTKGIFFGAKSYNMQDNFGQINESHSISAGLDFPSVGPEHAYLRDLGRAEYVSITDEEALSAFKELSMHEGIIPALESSHAVAQALKIARANPDKEMTIIANLSGRGDKDIFTVAKVLEERGEF